MFSSYFYHRYHSHRWNSHYVNIHLTSSERVTRSFEISQCILKTLSSTKTACPVKETLIFRKCCVSIGNLSHFLFLQKMLSIIQHLLLVIQTLDISSIVSLQESVQEYKFSLECYVGSTSTFRFSKLFLRLLLFYFSFYSNS